MKHHDGIDFVARRRWPLAGVALALLGLAAVAWQGTESLREFELLQRQRVGLASLQRQPIARPTMSAEDIKRHGQMEAVARYLATPWQRLLGLFDERVPAGVVLLKFNADAASGRVEIGGRAAGAQVLGDFVVALEADPRLGGVLMTQHRVLRDEAGSGIEFAVGANWGAAAAPSAPASAASGVSP